MTDLTFHDVTRRLEVDVSATIGRDGTIAVEGQFAGRASVRRITAQLPGIECPSEVKVRVRLVLGAG